MLALVSVQPLGCRSSCGAEIFSTKITLNNFSLLQVMLVTMPQYLVIRERMASHCVTYTSHHAIRIRRITQKCRRDYFRHFFLKSEAFV